MRRKAVFNLYESDKVVTRGHTWDDQGTFLIKACTKDNIERAWFPIKK